MIFLGGILVEWSVRKTNSGIKYSRKDLIYPIIGGVTLGVGSILRKYALNLFEAQF
jgi:hypothetical protein